MRAVRIRNDPHYFAGNAAACGRVQPARMTHLTITYRDFHGVPRLFALEAEPGVALTFDCPFDDEDDDFPDFYEVWSIETELSEAIERYQSPDQKPGPAHLGVLNVSVVEFDRTRRATVDAGILELVHTLG
jgi:hypothetical protein